MDQTHARQEGPLLLVVEDDENSRSALASVLVGHGCRVIECSTGLEATATLQAGELPELIVLDLLMPVMDGWALREWLLRRPECAQIPVIVLSGDLSSRSRCVQADAFLTKPLSAGPLLRTVDALLRGHLGQHSAFSHASALRPE